MRCVPSSSLNIIVCCEITTKNFREIFFVTMVDVVSQCFYSVSSTVGNDESSTTDTRAISVLSICFLIPIFLPVVCFVSLSGENSPPHVALAA